MATKYSYTSSLPAKRNYGAITELSKDINRAFGDKSGRTVSTRTADGFKNTFNLQNMNDHDAEDIVHLSMTSTALLLSAKSDGAKACGVLLLAALFACYQNGK